ncbi:hypothetical protein BSKO_11320 [Bryopsis sp. KO-2023]|nr:hypothetical protein BSKO_11320 [Bryopsis sp. KO-2023]
METMEEARELICDLCRNMYRLGWVSGTGGGISVKSGDKIVMAPSGVQKERMLPEDMFVLDGDGNTLQVPEQRRGLKPPKLSECAPLFMAAYKLRGAGAVLHSHSINAMLATLLDEKATEFKITQLEMMKGVEGYGFYDEMVVPIIENTARESQLTARLTEAIKAYPKAKAVLVRRHGVYVWGRDWIQAKGHAECYDFLFESAVRMRQLGLPIQSPSSTNGAEISHKRASMSFENGTHGTIVEGGHQRKRIRSSALLPRAVILDIEGTIAPVYYRTEVMIPYVLSNVRQHLESTYTSLETQATIEAIRLHCTRENTECIPDSNSGMAAVLDACCAWVDRSKNKKIPELLTLQAQILRDGFENGELSAPLFDDVLGAIRQWEASGVKIYIYSSLPRNAQTKFFANTKGGGDIRGHICGFFDTSSGSKTNPASYKDIALMLGIDHLVEKIVFVTDILGEAKAASEAGLEPVIINRPGNAEIAEPQDFKVVETLADLTVQWHEN